MTDEQLKQANYLQTQIKRTNIAIERSKSTAIGFYSSDTYYSFKHNSDGDQDVLNIVNEIAVTTRILLQQKLNERLNALQTEFNKI